MKEVRTNLPTDDRGTSVEPVDSLNKLLGSMQLVDLSPRLERGMPRWPTHPHFVLDKTMTHAHDGYYCQSLAMPEHLGCHCDAPAHSLADKPAATIDCVSLRHLLAPAVVYDFSTLNLNAGELIDASHIEQMEQECGIRVGANEIALVNFGWLRRHWRTDERAQWYAQNSPGMTEAAVRLFASRGLRAVGADTIACEVPIVDGTPGDNPGHMKHWLPNGILIVECVANLEKVAKRAFFAALPLPIAEGSGSPLRPIALF